MNDLRIAATELLPLDADRREMSLVYLAFQAQAAVVPALCDAAEGAAQRLQEPLAARIAHLVKAGELHTSSEWALAVLDDHLAALAAGWRTPAAGAGPRAGTL